MQIILRFLAKSCNIVRLKNNLLQVSRKLFPRLTAMVDYLIELATFDKDWDVRFFDNLLSLSSNINTNIS